MVGNVVGNVLGTGVRCPQCGSSELFLMGGNKFRAERKYKCTHCGERFETNDYD